VIVCESSTTSWIVERAQQLGFAMCGVVRAEAFPELSRTQEWLARGFAGEMKYLYDSRRGDARSAMPGLQSVIVCALTYNTGLPRTAQAFAEMSAPSQDAPRGWISRYAWGDEYHEVMRNKLEALQDALRIHIAEPFEARIYADTGPINERVLAKHAGLGWLGKNTLLLNEKAGSFFFLGVILLSLDLQPSLSAADAPPPDRCGSCRKCLDACPTDALVEPYLMDARKCISYLTIELRGPIPHDLREAMGPHIFGCDICQDVCPWNRTAPVTMATAFQPRNFHSQSGAPGPSAYLPSLEWLAGLSDVEFREIFRNSPVKRTKWKGLIRNVCMALGNSSPQGVARQRVISLLSRLAGSEESLISESAQWAISRIEEVSAGQYASASRDATGQAL
jgi:epoxyqueuosine reductase